MSKPATHTEQLSSLAGRLVKASTQAERATLLRRDAELVDLALANKIKELCYEAWASEPTIARRAAAALDLIEKRVPSPEIKAVMYWTRGISDITKGRLESAVKNLDLSSATFKEVNDIGESARCQVAAVLALAMLGRYDEAVKAGQEALKIFLKIGDGLAAAKVELNLSNIAFRRERHLESEKLYLSAIKRFTELGEREWKTMAENGLANAYAEIGSITKADKYYKRSLKSAQSAGMLVTEAEIEASLGNLYRSRGEYRDALRYLELSRAKYERLKMPHQSAIAELEIADIYAELNLNPEALQAYEGLIPLLAKLKLRAEEARARVNFGRVRHASHRTPDARRQLRKAIRLYKLEENTAGEAMALIVVAAIDNELGNLAAAAESVSLAEKLLKDLQLPRRSLNAAWLHAEVERKLGADVQMAFEEILSDAKRLYDPAAEIATLSSLAKIATEQGNIGLAVRRYRRAVRIVEALRAPLPGEEFRRSIVADKMGPYNELAQLYVSEVKLRQAFKLVERSRSRSLDELFESDRIRTKESKAYSEFRERLNWTYSKYESSTGAEMDRLRAESLMLERQMAELNRRQQSTSVELTGLFPKLSREVDVAALQSKLGKDRVLIEYVSFDNKIGAFVLTDRRLRYVPGLSAVSNVESLIEELHYQFASLRFGSANLGSFASILKRKTDHVLNRLHDALIKPLEKHVAARHLVISPSQALNYVPFAALYDGSNYLIESREIVQAPSGALWLEMAKRTGRKIDPAVLLGFADQNIPLVNTEITALADLFTSSVVLTGKKASFQAFKEQGPNAGLLHVACHSRFRPDNPMYSSLHLSDGWVTVSDILGMNLKAELVSLSACETGINKIYPGEEVVGFTRGFLAAGASNVILSLWNANDKTTARLMIDLYSALHNGLSIAASLRLAQRKLIESGEHPYFWAPFLLIGR